MHNVHYSNRLLADHNQDEISRSVSQYNVFCTNSVSSDGSVYVHNIGQGKVGTGQ